MRYSVKTVPHYKYLIKFSHPQDKVNFLFWFATTKTEINYVGKRRVFNKVSNHSELASGKDWALIRRGTIEWFLYWVKLQENQSTSDVGFNLNQYYFQKVEWEADKEGEALSIPKKWLNYFNSHPRGTEYGNAQKKSTLALLGYYGSSIQIGTGIGKTLISIAVLDTLLKFNPTHRILINITGYPIIENFLNSCKKFKFEYAIGTGTKMSEDNRLHIINPVGFMASKYSETDEAKSWLSKVTIMLTDECQDLSSNSNLTLVDNYLPKLSHSYGVSATLDNLNGLMLKPTISAPANLDPRNLDVVGVSGAVHYSKKILVPTNLYLIHSAISDSSALMDLELEYQHKRTGIPPSEKLSISFTSLKLSEVISKTYWNSLATSIDYSTSFTYPIAYIPYSKIEDGSSLTENLINRGLLTLNWNANVISYCGFNVSDATDCEKITKLVHGNSYLKRKFKVTSSDWKFKKMKHELATIVTLSKLNVYQLLLTSKLSYKGVDLKGLSAVFLHVGSNHAMILQPIGRSARGDKLKVYLINDTTNPMLVRQFNKRKKKVISEYKIESISTINL